MIHDHCELTRPYACLCPFLTNVPSAQIKSWDAYLILGLNPTYLPTLFIQPDFTCFYITFNLAPIHASLPHPAPIKFINDRQINIHTDNVWTQELKNYTYQYPDEALKSRLPISKQFKTFVCTWKLVCPRSSWMSLWTNLVGGIIGIWDWGTLSEGHTF